MLFPFVLQHFFDFFLVFGIDGIKSVVVLDRRENVASLFVFVQTIDNHVVFSDFVVRYHRIQKMYQSPL